LGLERVNGWLWCYHVLQRYSLFELRVPLFSNACAVQVFSHAKRKKYVRNSNLCILSCRVMVSKRSARDVKKRKTTRRKSFATEFSRFFIKDYLKIVQIKCNHALRRMTRRFCCPQDASNQVSA